MHWSKWKSKTTALQKTCSSPPSKRQKKFISSQNPKSAASEALPPMRKQSAAGLPSLAPHDSKARLISVTTCRRFMAKPCTPHLHCAARAVIQAANCQCWGSRGAPLVLSLGGIRGIFSFEKENIPLSRVPHTVWGIIECALRAQKKKHPFGCSLFIQQ